MSRPAPPPPIEVREPIEAPTASSLRRVAVVAAGEDGYLVKGTKEDPVLLSEVYEARERIADGTFEEPRKCKCGADGGKISICPDCQRKKYGDFNHGGGGQGDPGWLKANDEIRALHLTKSGGYGTGSDPFANFSSVSAVSGTPRYLYPILRSLEKLSRCMSLHSQGRVEELDEEFLDIASLMLCATAMRRADS